MSTLTEKPQSRATLDLPSIDPQRGANGPIRSWSATSISLTLLATLAVLATMYCARAILFPVALAFVIAFPLRPIVRWMGYFRIPAAVAAALVVCGLMGVVAITTYSLSRPARDWMESGPENLRRAEYKLRSLLAPLEDIKEASKQVENLAEATSSESTVEVQIKQPSLTSTLVNATGDFLVGGMVTVSLVFLLLAFGDALLTNTINGLPTAADKQNIRELCDNTERTISSYLLNYSIINAGLGLVIGVGLWIIGMPNPLLWGVMAAAFNFLPFVGLIAGTAVVTLVALLTFDSVAYAMLAPGIYLVANGIECNAVTPAILGRQLKLNPIAIFLFVVVWGWMWGIGGALIAVPILAVAAITCDRFSSLKMIGNLLRG